MYHNYPGGKLPLSKRKQGRKLRRLIGFTEDAFLKLDLICVYEKKGIADLIEELINERWETEEQAILENIDERIASVRVSHMLNKISKVREPKGTRQTNQVVDFPLEPV